jgi:hypothetical protein
LAGVTKGNSSGGCRVEQGAFLDGVIFASGHSHDLQVVCLADYALRSVVIGVETVGNGVVETGGLIVVENVTGNACSALG